MSPVGAGGPISRTEYRDGHILRAADLDRDQGYFLARARQHAGLAHEPGILMGLRIRAFERGTESPVLEAGLGAQGDADAKPLDLYLDSGVGVDDYGRVASLGRRTHLGPEYSPRRLGWYRVELLYERVQGGTQGRSSCAPGGVAILQEGAVLRLRPEDEPLPAITPEDVLDGPPDSADKEAPIALGMVYWDTALEAFTLYSTQARRYAGAIGWRLRSPSQDAELALSDDRGRVAVRTSPEMSPEGAEDPFLPGPVQDRVRVDRDGAVWTQAEVSVGPTGVRFRPSQESAGTNWRAEMVQPPEGEAGAQFGRDAGGEPTEEYFPGDHELRVVFERDSSGTGLRRVVIGHVDQVAGEFQPAVVVYDKTPSEDTDGNATVEVWGDLYVRGTAWLNKVSRIPADPGADQDALDLILRQMAGPLGEMLRAFLLTDPAWLAEFAHAVMGNDELVATIAAGVTTDDIVADAVTQAVPLAADQAATTAEAAVLDALENDSSAGLLLFKALYTETTTSNADFEDAMQRFFWRMKADVLGGPWETWVLGLQEP